MGTAAHQQHAQFDPIDHDDNPRFMTGAVGPAPFGATGSRSLLSGQAQILFDVSDLIYYIGHHPNLTGIQRVQSSIVLSIVRGVLFPSTSVIFLSFNAKNKRWGVIPTGFFVSLLEDLFLPARLRLVTFSTEDARHGVLPGAMDFDPVGTLGERPSVLCLLGAAWVQRDYFHRILSLKRRFGTRFVMMVHDLIPIYAPDTCDQGTTRVFSTFLRRAVWHVDHYLTVSEYTAKDLRRYIGSLPLPEPPITVTRNGSSFGEFLQQSTVKDEFNPTGLPDRFVLFVATIEGRKNHRLMFEVWRRMIEAGDDVPQLVCVGRVGWKAEEFLAKLVETNYLNGKVILLQDVSDAYLRHLYNQCLFTVCPSFYEGWGLPIGESLAAGKICVCSNRASLPEVAGDLGVYIDIDSIELSVVVIRRLILDEVARQYHEEDIRRLYRPITWQSVAEVVITTCEAATKAEWLDPYPYSAVPYSTEISFARLTQDEERSFGNDLLTEIVSARRGYFLRDFLQERNFQRGEEARSGGQWAEIEKWGTWLCEHRGDLTLALAPHESHLYYIYLRLRVSKPLSDLPIRLFANGELAWNDCIGSRPRNIVLRVSKNAASTNGWWLLQVRAEIDLSTETRSQIAMLDTRIPTIGFERLVVVPDSDLKSRIDILTFLM
jgi:glycosyltransferase involved in cell wall biosynthesis